MIGRLSNLLGLVVSLLLAYGAIYFGYRMFHTETWDADGKQYVIFGSRASYLIFRPAAYVDGTITGMRFHLGPHRRPEPTL